MEDFNAQWRASAHEAVPYTMDFPECLLILPELTDGAIGQGKATRVIINIILYEQKGVLIVSDNGKGITNPNRLLLWASKESHDVHHRYGHGSKKCLTKWHKDYDTAKWSIKYRIKDKRGSISSLYVYKAPFIGNKKSFEEDDKDDSTLVPSGTEWEIDFDRTILGELNTKDDLFDAIKEILRTRYSKEHFDNTEFILTVTDDSHRSESSKEQKWKTFEECLQEEVVLKRAEITYNESILFNNGNMLYTQYRLLVNGRSNYNLKEQFPHYGTKSQKYARLHISISGRTIEIPYIHEFYKGRTNTHNDFNGLIGIVKFIPDTPDNYEQMPTPCTTKVSFYPNCPNYKKFTEIMYNIHASLTQKKKKIEINVENEQKQEHMQEQIQEQEQEQEQEQLEPLNSKRKKLGKGARMAVWNKHIGEDILKHKCFCCKIAYISKDDFEAGHIKSVANHGDNSIENLRPICFNCNRSMGSMNMDIYIIEHKYWY